MNILEDFGDGFVSLSCSSSNEDELAAHIARHRAILLPTGHIVLKEPDGTCAFVLDDVELARNGIHSVSGQGDMTVVSLCGTDPGKHRDAMIFLKDHVFEIAARLSAAAR